ncbi:MAG: tetratricopeptide repeat protein, partial [Planctomycetota bacterium]
QAYFNLADLYRAQGREQDSEKVLHQGLGRVSNSAELHHALGLLLVRRKRTPEALRHLERAADLRPQNPRFGYVFGVALHDTGQPDRAMLVLERTHRRNPGDASVLRALVSYHRERASGNPGALDQAIHFARKLRQLVPGDGTHRLLEELEAKARRKKRTP